jgi:hypothetical protein
VTGPRRILAITALVVLTAPVQATLVALAPRDPLSAAGLVFAALSLLALVLAAWILARLTGAPAAPAPRLGWTAAAAVAVALSALALPAAVPLVVAVGAVVLAAGSPRAAVRVVREHPGRSVLWAALTILAVVVGWAAALLIGLLIGDAIGSAATWLVVGALAALVAGAWGRLASSPRAEPTAVEPRRG